MNFLVVFKNGNLCSYKVPEYDKLILKHLVDIEVLNLCLIWASRWAH